MDVRRWHEENVEELSEGIGRQAHHTSRLTVARIFLRAGAVVREHAHEQEQVATVLSGRLRFRIDETETLLAKDESIVVPSGVPHTVEALEDSVVLDVFAPARDDWLRGEDAYLRSPVDG